MKHVICLCFLFLLPLGAEIDDWVMALNSEKFEARETAEKDLIEWAKKDEKGERSEELFQRFLISDDPEEFRRLTEILLAVHFEYKKDSIPQNGPGFIGISMMPVGRALRRFQPRGFEQGQQPNQQELEFLRFPDEEELKKGVFIEAVIEGTPAEAAGLKEGDIILEIDGKSIAGEDPTALLKEIVGGQPPGTALELTIERDGKKLKKEVTLMNAKALPVSRMLGDQPRVDVEKAAQLLKDDYLQWLMTQRAEHQAQ